MDLVSCLQCCHGPFRAQNDSAQAERIHPTRGSNSKKAGSYLNIAFLAKSSALLRGGPVMNGDKQPTRKIKHTHTDRPVRPGTQQGPQVLCITVSLNFGHRSGLRGSLFKVQLVYRTLHWASFNCSPQGKGSRGPYVSTWSLCSQPVPFSPRPGTQDPRIIS